MPHFPVMVSVRLLVMNAQDGADATQRAREDVLSILQAGMFDHEVRHFPLRLQNIQVIKSELIGPPVE